MKRHVSRSQHSGGGPATACITSAHHLSVVGGHWDDLVERDPRSHAFQTHAWLSTWLDHHPETPPFIPIVHRRDRLTAALPLCVHDAWGVVRFRTLRFVADNDSDYCDALSDPEYPEDLELLWEEILRRWDWHLLDLRYVLAESHTAALMQRRPGGVRVHRRSLDIAPFLDITADWRETMDREDSARIKRAFRRIQEKGVLTLETADTPELVDAMLDQLAALHVARWQSRNQTSVFRIPAHAAWLRALCRQFLERGWLRLCRLSLDGNLVSIGLYFLHRQRLLGYVGAFDDEYARFAPGHLLEAAVVDDVRARGLATVDDFGRGGESYKLRWANQTRTVDRFVVARRSPLALGVYTWSCRLKPILWRHRRLGTFAREVRRRWRLSREDRDGPVR